MSIIILYWFSVCSLVCQVQARIFINRGNSVQEIDDSCLGPLNSMLDGSSCAPPEITPPVITILPSKFDFNNAIENPVQLQDQEVLLTQESDQGQQFDRFQIKLGATFGVDTRQKVPFTTKIPYRSIGQIDGTQRCTASVIGPRHIITAAHCIENHPKWTFFPARDRIFFSPYGEYDWSIAYIPDEYLSRQHDFFEYDYAIVVLKNNLDFQIPAFKFNFNCDNTQITENLNLAGYPYGQFKYIMFKNECKNVKINCNWRYFLHECDTREGMSGSPMFFVDQKGDGNVEYVIFGIHGGEVEGGEVQGGRANYGIIMTKKIQQQIQQWLEVFP